MRTAIVTGGLQGIGLAIAAELTRRGIRVAGGARRGGDANHCLAEKAQSAAKVWSRLWMSAQMTPSTTLWI